MAKKTIFLICLIASALVLALAMTAVTVDPIRQTANPTPYPTWVPFRAYPVDVPETIPPGDWAVPIENYLRHKDPVTAGSTWISPMDEDRWTVRGFLPVTGGEGE